MHKGIVEINALLVKLSILAGADVDIQKHSHTELHFAACRNQDIIVEILVNASATINIRNQFGETPLHQAAYSDADRSVQKLIEVGADLNIQDQDGNTPLHRTTSDTVAQILIQAGADLNIVDYLYYNKTPLQLIQPKNMTDILLKTEPEKATCCIS